MHLSFAITLFVLLAAVLPLQLTPRTVVVSSAVSRRLTMLHLAPTLIPLLSAAPAKDYYNETYDFFRRSF